MDSYHGHYQRQGPVFYLPSLTPVVKLLIWTNVGAYVLYLLVRRAGGELGFKAFFALVPSLLLHGRVWQLVTYAFLHGGVWHILWNMLALYFFAGDLERMYGPRRFLYLYLGAAAFGGLVHVLTVLLSGSGMNIPVVGASGAVMAVMVLFAMHFPNRIIIFWFIPVRARTLVFLWIGANILMILGDTAGNVAVMVHLGGAAFGFLYYRFQGVVSHWLDDLQYRRQRKHIMREEEAEEKVDELLDKISREGFDSLTRSERAFLLKESRKRSERH